VNWIKSCGALLCVALHAGCASQDPVIPQTGRDMQEIYRQALDRPAAAPVFGDEATRLCQQLPVEGDPGRCQQKASAILEAQRGALDPNPQQETLTYLSYTRSADNELEQLFPRLPNPDLVIYVYPHLATRTRAPIPGYTSVIPLFERVEYQLPGELPPLDE